MIATPEQRSTWRWCREQLGLHDPTVEDFALGGLAARADPLDVRVVILPADPDAGDAVALDDATAEWMKGDHPLPSGVQPFRWAYDVIATSHALVLPAWYRDDGRWDRYLALNRHGGLEAGMATVVDVQRDRRMFALQHLASLVWYVAMLQREVAASWQISGPWQIILALRDTLGAGLWMFAEGSNHHRPWPFEPSTACGERHVLHIWECLDVDPEFLGIDAGARIENSFGTTRRRHILRTGPNEGKLDLRLGW